MQRGDEQEPVRMSAQFLFMCTGYYRYDAGYTPDFAGRESFAGQVIHPQLWPENFDYSGKRIVVIGSGATAVTLIPSLTASGVERLINERVITGGMIPKVRSALQALADGVRKVHMIDGRIPHSLLLEIFTEHGIGTEITEG